MLTSNLKTYGFLAIVAILLVGQVIRRLPGSHTLNWEAGGSRVVTGDQPYSVKDGVGSPMERPHLKIDHISLSGGISRETLQKFAAATAATAAVGTPAVAPVDAAKAEKDAKKKLEECDILNPKVDPKTGIPVACKTRKVKPGQTTAAGEVPAASSNSATPDSSGGISHSDQNMGGGVGAQEVVALAKKDAYDDSLEAWQKRLLGVPDLADAKIFVQHYQNGAVTADVFYQITEQMVADLRDEMKTIGIMCAGVTPSVISFQILADQQSTLPSGSTVRVSAEGYLANYSDLNYLGLLSRVLKGSADTAASLAALERLDASAQRYQKLVRTSTNAKSTAKIYQYFQSFVTTLTGLEKSSDSTIAYQSKHTLGDIQTLVAATSSPGSSPTTSPATISVASTQP